VPAEPAADAAGSAPVPVPVPAPVLHRARFVLPIAAPPLADGAVLVAGETIRAVGLYRDLAPHHAGGVADHGDQVLLPALVNAHTHLELSALAGRILDGLDFAEWLATTTTQAAALSVEAAAPAIDVAIAALVACGTGLIGEVSDTGRTVAALARSPLAARVFHEVIAFDPRAAEPALVAARERLAASEALTGPGGAIRHSLAPHAPYTVSMRLLRLIRGVNGQDGRPTTIHLAESPAETEFFAAGSGPLAELKRRFSTTVSGWEAPGESPVVYLARIGWFEAPQLAVHLTQLSARDIEILRRAPATACLCPRSNRALGVGAAPAGALAAAGIPLALGTDSLASAPSLSLFDELAVAAADYELEPALLLAAATRGGARALGFGAEWGELAPGRRARTILVAPPPGVPLGDDPYAVLLDRPGPDRIRWVSPPHAPPVSLGPSTEPTGQG
jgi:cytosine/adenosine deaminase-related metal-dependent hydrolase